MKTVKQPETFDEKVDALRDAWEEQIFEDNDGHPYIDPDLDVALQAACEIVAKHWNGTWDQMIERFNEAWWHYRDSETKWRT